MRTKNYGWNESKKGDRSIFAILNHFNDRIRVPNRYWNDTAAGSMLTVLSYVKSLNAEQLLTDNYG